MLRQYGLRVLMLALLLCSLTVGAFSAEKLTADKLWRYEISGNIALIKAYLGSTEELTIPAEIDGYPTAIYQLSVTADRIIIPAGVQAVYANAFAESNIAQVIIEDADTQLQAEAFNSCNTLLSITLPDEWTSLPDSCFNACTALTDIHLPEQLTSIGNSCFDGCNRLTSIDLPKGLERIGVASFRSCSSLSTIDLPDTVTSVGSHAFSYCTRLTSISLPDSITSLDTSASVFRDCTALKTIHLPASLTGRIRNYFFMNCKSLETISLPDGITELGQEVFSGCSSLHMVTLPVSLAGVLGEADDHGPFYGTTVTSFYAKKGTWAYNYGLAKGWTYTSPNPFAWTQTFYSGFIQEGVQLLWTGDAPDGFELDTEEAAVSAEGLITADRPGLITIVAVADDKYYEAAVLLRDANPLVVPPSISIIEEEAFANTNCSEILLSEGLRELGPRVFASCDRLGIIALPDTLTVVDPDAFEGCEDVLFLVHAGNPLSEWLTEHNYHTWDPDVDKL